MPVPLAHSSKTLLVICLSAVCWAFSFGVGAALASLWLKDAGWGELVVGVNTGIYYMGIALAATVVPWMMRHWGRGCLVAGMVASAVTVAWFPWGGSLAGYCLLRLLHGPARGKEPVSAATPVQSHR